MNLVQLADCFLLNNSEFIELFTLLSKKSTSFSKKKVIFSLSVLERPPLSITVSVHKQNGLLGFE